VLKVVYFLCTKKRAWFGVYFSIPIHNLLQSKVSKYSFKTFDYNSRTIIKLTNIWHHSEQPWKSHTWIFRISFGIFEISMFGHVTKGSQTFWGSDGMRVIGKWHKNVLIPCFGADYVLEWRNIPQTVYKKNTTFSTERIIALRSVDKIFPES
jgi:hypothetical protein